MNVFEKLLGALHLNFLNRTNSPSQKIQLANAPVETIQQAGRDIVNANPTTSPPAIEVSHQSAVSNLDRYNQVNIHTQKRSLEPLIILECTFDGIPTNHGSQRLNERDVFHFDTLNRENISDGYEPEFMLRVRKQTREEFVFRSKLRIRLYGNRYDLEVTGNEFVERL
ncbi:MAG: hypothetical protein AAB388_05070 [Patescibacteria group bacterium]